jgi:nucleoid DNA-binding protein
MTKSERNILKLAGGILGEELKNGRKVRIPGFGVFSTGVRSCTETPPWMEGDKQKFMKVVPKFRAFSGLKALVARVKFYT